MGTANLRSVPTLSVTSRAYAANDSTVSSNPLRRSFDWQRARQFPVLRAPTYDVQVPPGGSISLFNGQRSTTLDSTTAFSVTLSPLSPSRYRFTWTGGTNPTLRTDRGLTLSGDAVTVTVNLDGTATFTLGSGTWGSVVAGDTVWVPGVSTGDSAGPFNVLNEGAWTVAAVLSSTVIQLVRPPGTLFQGASETQTPSSNSQLVAFSGTGVLVGDSLFITSGFASATQRGYQVAQVTSTWFEVVSVNPVPLESGKMPGAAGLLFYTSGKRWLSVEADQECLVQPNGVTDGRLHLSPVVAADPENTGWYETSGVTWSLTLVNLSSSVMRASVRSAE